MNITIIMLSLLGIFSVTKSENFHEFSTKTLWF